MRYLHFMTMMPKPKPGDFERLKWSRAPRDLEGRVLSMKELQERFPSSDGYSEIRLLKDERGYKILGRVYGDGHLGFPQYIAYECKGCNKLVAGRPEIVDDTSIELGIPLTGREGYDLYCRNCQAHLDGKTLKMS
jgi:hypothetical protein